MTTRSFPLGPDIPVAGADRLLDRIANVVNVQERMEIEQPGRLPMYGEVLDEVSDRQRGAPHYRR